MIIFKKVFFTNLILIGIFIIVSFSFVVAQTIPPYIHYQGRLVDQEKGTPIQGEKSITFSLYHSETGGNPIYSQTQQVSVTNGSFSVYLGSGEGFYDGNNVIVDGIPVEVFTEHSARYLGIKIEDSVSEMVPRHLIASAAFAYQAEKATEAEHIMGQITVDSGSGNVGIGTSVPTEKLEVIGVVKADSFIGRGSGITEIGSVATASILNAFKGHLMGLRISYVSPQ